MVYNHSYNWREGCSQNWERTPHTWDIMAKVGQRKYIQIYAHMTHWALKRGGRGPQEGSSHIARDILVIPESTVSSEQAFSTSGRIIEPRRNCLTPEMVEVLICIRDWEHARKRMQNETVDEQFIQNFFNLYVDEDSGSNQVQN
ncbi:hypothetical protein Dsin_009282 [Dipteronia sinensis]|uniref:HAT C-terminal dimerisation domain-containing protein n=1 Tax=Dipteronia sinensis TaxID=43782 RepID=A0AAE0AQN6_9ROSI|nr:hypothetical protein Dsin_009282 [Dipteronia sinensis]